MNEVVRWVLGVIFTLVLGSYGFTYTMSSVDSNERQKLEDRLSKQLDIIEHKVDRLIERQWEERKR